ncbi:TPA: hypothetical protein ACK4L9_000529, partial [Neisseria gonorrhoeae]
ACTYGPRPLSSLAACAAEGKRREEKRRFFAGWIHFRLLIRFDRLKKRFSLMLKGGLYRVPGGVSIRNNKKAAIMV